MKKSNYLTPEEYAEIFFFACERFKAFFECEKCKYRKAWEGEKFETMRCVNRLGNCNGVMKIKFKTLKRR